MMTREEAIKQLECLRLHCRTMIRDEYEDAIWVQDVEAIDFALSALHPVSREQVEKVWRGEWVLEMIGAFEHLKAYSCSNCGYTLPFNPTKIPEFCENCGAPMTDEAVQMVMERLEALNENRD